MNPQMFHHLSVTIKMIHPDMAVVMCYLDGVRKYERGFTTAQAAFDFAAAFVNDHVPKEEQIKSYGQSVDQE